MKILLVGSNFEYAIEKYYTRYLTQFGCEIRLFDAPDIIFRRHSKNLLNKVLFKTGISTGYPGVNKSLIRIATESKPDIIWVWKGMELYPSTLKWLKARFKLANYNPDHPFIITSKGSGNLNVKNSVQYYHLHFCYHSQLMKQIEDEYQIPSVFLPFAYDRMDMVYTEPETISEINRVCFQANPDEYRVNKIRLLTEAGLEVDIYGHDWHKTALRKNKLIRIHPIASRKNFWYLNQQYRLQLNLFREYNNESHNMRTFEIPAVGGIQLTPWSTEQAEFFKENQEIFFFRDDNEMVSEAKRILSMTSSSADRIRAAAKKRSQESEYSFEDRSLTVLKTFNKMLK